MAHLPKGQGLIPMPPFMSWLSNNVPAVYDNTMSYYEELCSLIKYLQDIIVPAVNHNAEALTTVSEALEQLKQYVDDYFANLDVQEEINNKLDQMAEDGTLQEIITAYIQANVAWTFDSVADMKSATNLVAGSYAQTLGYYAVNDGGESLYKITNTVDSNNFQIDLENGLYATLIVTNNTLNAMQVGCVGDGETDDTDNLQLAFDTACDLNYTLFIPARKFYVTDSINIKSSINVKGESLSTYKRISEINVNFGDTDKPLFNAGRIPRCTFENIKIQRERTATDGYPTDPLAYGKSATCFDFESNESVFNRCVINGFNVVFNHLQITTCQECDFIYCNSIIKTSNQVNAVNFINCNCYANGVLFDINATTQTLNITDCWVEDFVTLFKNYYKTVQNFNVTNSTLTNTVKGEAYIVYEGSAVFSRQYYNFVNSTLYIKQNICDIKPSSTEFEMRLINCSVLYGGSGETIDIVGNSKFMNLSSQNIDSLVNKGLDFSNNLSNTLLKFKQYTTLPDKTETGLYYNSNNTAKRLEYWNNSNSRNLIVPTVINQNNNTTKPSFTPTCMTFALNQLMYAGDSLGWVFHPTTNDWVQLPSIGQRTYTANPSGALTPKRLGEMVFDTTHNIWYISTGTANTDWVALNS